MSSSISVMLLRHDDKDHTSKDIENILQARGDLYTYYSLKTVSMTFFQDFMKKEEILPFSYGIFYLKNSKKTSTDNLTKDINLKKWKDLVMSMGLQSIPILLMGESFGAFIELFGGETEVLPPLEKRSKKSMLYHDDQGIFQNLENPLLIETTTPLIRPLLLPKCIKILSLNMENTTIMAVQHKVFPIIAVQFSPRKLPMLFWENFFLGNWV